MEAQDHIQGGQPLAPLVLGGASDSPLKKKLAELLPEGGNINMCLACGLCSAGCPATGLEGMDPRKFVRMAALGLDEEIAKSNWQWMCTMCRRCIYACPMQVDIPQLIYLARAEIPREERPKGIRGSCDVALGTPTNSAMGTTPEDFKFVVQDILAEVQESQPVCEDLEISMDRKGAHYFLNQNSREPVTEPDEMVPLWKILKIVGADWTYASKGWAAENYCMFLADDASWEANLRNKMQTVQELGSKVWLNTE